MASSAPVTHAMHRNSEPPLPSTPQDPTQVEGADEGWDDSSEIRALRPPPEHVTVHQSTVTSLLDLAHAPNSEQAARIGARLRQQPMGLPAPLHALVERLQDQAKELDELKRLAGLDELTGIANRRIFNDALQREAARAQRTAKPLCVLMLDLDQLKLLNDQQGHAMGDRAIQRAAYECTCAVRDSDLVARLGGDEFAVLLPETDLERATAIGARIQRRVAERNVAGTPLGISFGAAQLGPSERDLDALLKRADRALYRDKHARGPHRG